MKYFLIAGEASGDLHASNLMKELKHVDSKASFCFLGGDLMQAQGGQQIKHYRDMAFMGFINVIKNTNKISKNFIDTKKAIQKFQPNVVILIDYPSFNLKIAKYVKENFKIQVHYYISPKIWAWKEFRIKSIKKYVDKMYTIFPFETQFYNKHHFKVNYVGNPTVEAIQNRSNQEQTFQEFIKKNNLPDKPIIALLPGSRKQEIIGCLPRMLEAASVFKDLQTVISGAPGIDKKFYDKFLEKTKSTTPIVFNQTYDLTTQADLAIVNSGTAVLEVALLHTPQVVVYDVPFGKFSRFLKNVLLKVKYVTLVNIIAQKEVVNELLADQFTVNNIQAEISRIINNKEYTNRMMNNYDEVENLLGDSNAAENAAKLIFNSLK